MKQGQTVKSLTGKTKGMVGTVEGFKRSYNSKLVLVKLPSGIGSRSYWFIKQNLKVLGHAKNNGSSGGGATT